MRADHEPWDFPGCPTSPWSVDFDALMARYPWLEELDGCPQDPIWHAEGDVLVHTKRVCEELAASETWRALDASARAIVFAAAVLHDIGKPPRTREESSRITSRGHARVGAHRAGYELWCLDDTPSAASFAARRHVVSLVRRHGVPMWLLDRPDPRVVVEASQTARCDWLALLAEAPARGREMLSRSFHPTFRKKKGSRQRNSLRQKLFASAVFFNWG